jgi:1-acyl-sn-glycerol-3-phosphate acyltransferase
MDKRAVLRGVVRFLFRLLMKVEVCGEENVPQSGGLLICTNHLAIFDPAFIYVYSGRKDLSALVAKKHQKNPLLRYLVNFVGGIWLNRDEADTQAIRLAQDFLKNGGCLGISPEGTRSPTHALIEGKTGAAYLANRAEIPILPVGLVNTHQIVPSLKRLRRPQIIVKFGIPFELPPVDRKDREAGLRRNTDEIMCQIAALLPEENRGVYCDHPRLREILSERQAV